MTEDEVVAYLEGKTAGMDGRSPTLAFDTNAIFGNTGRDAGFELINAINRANAERGDAPEVGLVVSSVVLHEKIRQMRQRYLGEFDDTQPLRFLREKHITVEAFDHSHALKVASRIQGLYPTKEDWWTFKKASCLNCLKVEESATSETGEACGATVDWLIVGHADAMGYLLVSDDRGPEFDAVTLRAKRDVTLAAAKRVLAARTV